MIRAVLLLLAAVVCGRAQDFARTFEEIRDQATTGQLYAFLYLLPKGGDLHHHFSLSSFAEDWYAVATDPQLSHGYRYYTRTRFQNCPDSPEPLLRFRTIQESTWRRLTACQQAEYEPLASLSPEVRAQWLSSLKLDRPDEGRNEFFEVVVPRLGELPRNPYLVTELLARNMKRYRAEGLRYLETQLAGTNFFAADGKLLDPAVGTRMIRDVLRRPDVMAAGMTVRFQHTVLRFSPIAEQALERAHDYVARNRDLWVAVNLAGREDNDKGYALRFLDTFRRLRRKQGGVALSLHGGEVDSPGPEVRNTLLLGATRVGHAVNLISDADTMLRMRNGPYLVETSLVSNRLLEYTPDLDAHPFPEYLRFGIPVCLNTDDAGVWDSNIVDEYMEATRRYRLTWDELVRLGRNSLQHAFVEPEVKERLLREYERDVRAFAARFVQGDWRRELDASKVPRSGYAVRTLGLGPD